MNTLSELIRRHTTCYHTTYKVQTVGSKDNTARTSIPRTILQVQAQLLGISIEQLLDKYKVEWRYDNTGLIVLCFVLK